MTSSNTLKKLVSISTALLLAVGGSLTSATPASAAVQNITGIDPQGTSPNTQVVSLAVSSCNFGFGAPTALTTEIQDFTVALNSNPAIVVSGAKNGSYITLTLTQTLQPTDTISVSYTRANGTISCTNGDTVGDTTSSLTYQLPAAPAWNQGSTQVTSITSTGASLNFQTDTSGSFIWTVRLAASAAPTTMSNIYTATYGVLDLAHSSSPAMISANSLKTVAVTGLSAGTSYKAYVRSTNFNGMLTSNLLEIPFTTTGSAQVSGTCSGQTGVTSMTASAATLSPGGSFNVIYNGNPALTGCTLPVNGFASGRYLNGNLLGTFYFSGNSTGLSASAISISFTTIQTQAGRALVDGDVYTWKIWTNPGNTQPAQNSAGDFSFSVTISGAAGSATPVTALSALQARNVLKPVPAAVQPLVPAFIALNKPMASIGGKVALSAGDFTGLVSAKIAGKSLDFILGNTGKITMTVPQGEAGKTADLVLTFNTGSIILQDAIKYVAPLDVAKVGERPIAIAAGAKKITAGAADQIRQAALANVKNDTIQCIAYSASNSAAAKAAAQLTAVQACGVAVKANSDLKVADVVVIVDKLKARTQGVGIKVYKADN